MMLNVFSYTYLPSVCFLWGGICPYHLPTFQLVGFIYIKWRQWHPTPVLLPGKSHGRGTWWASVHGVAKSRTQLSDFPFTFHFHALEKEMATHSSVLAWTIPGTGEPGGLPSMGSHKVGHDWSDLAAAAVYKRHSRNICAINEGVFPLVLHLPQVLIAISPKEGPKV